MRRPSVNVFAGLRARNRLLPVRQSLSSRPLPLSSTISLIHPSSNPSQHQTSSYHHHSSSSQPALTTFSSSSTKRPHLPPPRSHLHQNRPFSLATPLAPILDSAVTLAQSTLHLYHSLPLPWYLAIPLFAGTLSLTTRLPTTIYARRIAIRRAMLAPLSRAWAVRLEQETDKFLIRRSSRGGNGSKGGNEPEQITEEVLGLEPQSERNKRWGVQTWKDWVPSLAVFPVWLVGIEGVRRMCGGPRGWLGALIFGAGGGDGGAASGLYVADPSLTTGGCLWFTDLTAADPYHVLPFALSAILVLNVVPRTRQMWEVLLATKKGTGPLLSSTDWRVRLQRGLLIVALAVGPVTMDLPAALHLYWIASATFTWVQTNLIWRAMPLPKMPPPAWKEPMYILPEREPTKEPTKGP
ncbi:hypothetical protein VTJ49DRAFT_3806 [Mycothermus thermophilus]|uniref:Uncharacterized protein n=1 Tax=Humicola insolens TaxID=85995 RepID=A0ABR3V6M4_HUMIN